MEGITGELRSRAVASPEDVTSVTFDRGEFEALCDRIDAVNGNLERLVADRRAEWPTASDGEPVMPGSCVTNGSTTFVVDEVALYADGTSSVLDANGIGWAPSDLWHTEDTYEAVVRDVRADVRCAGSVEEWVERFGRAYVMRLEGIAGGGR